jgi:hypothetical protein
MEGLNVLPLAPQLEAHPLNIGTDIGEFHRPTSLAQYWPN